MGGTRVWKKITRNGNVETRVYVHAGPNLIAEYIAGVGASTPVQEYVYADQIDSLVMIHRSNNQKLGVTRNRQWSVVGLHDLANGNVVERYAYDMSGKRTIYAANGTTVRTTSSFGNHFGYTNRWHDEESGLINFRARYYNPLTGEFLRRDPLGFEDGMSLYRGYMELGWVDPTGTVKVLCECRLPSVAGVGGMAPTREVEYDCRGLIEDCCKKACRDTGSWTGKDRIKPRPEWAPSWDVDDIASQNYVPGIGTYLGTYVFSWESPHPHDPVDLWLTRGKLAAGTVAVGAGGWAAYLAYGPAAIAIFLGKEALEAGKDMAFESTIGFSPPTGIRGGLKSIRDFFGKLLTPKPGNKHWTELFPLPKGARRGAIGPDGREKRVRQRGQRMTSEDDPFEQLDQVDEAQSRVRKMQRKSNQLDDDIDEEHNPIDQIGKSEGRVKKAMKDLARDPKCGKKDN